MKSFTVIKTIKTRDGQLVLQEGDELNPIPKFTGYDAFGIDARNRFWTDEFLLSKPHLFRANP